MGIKITHGVVPFVTLVIVAACSGGLLTAFDLPDYAPSHEPYHPHVTTTPTDVTYVSSGWLRLATPWSYQLLDFQNRQTDKELTILQERSARSWHDRFVLTGGQARLSFLAASTNTADKFPYLGRFPTDFTGDVATDARLLQANSHITAGVTPWATVYGEILFSDVFTFDSFDQGSLQVRQAYAVFGNLDVAPWYAYIGKKNVGFGDMSTLSPFTQSTVWHYFSALAEGVGVGYHDDMFDLTFAGINGGRGIRVADSTSRGTLNNFAANAAVTLGSAETCRLRLGGGFLRGTIYDGLAAEHLDTNQFGDFFNSAWDVNFCLDIGRLSLAGEFVSTIEPWPVTNERVSAYRAEASWSLATAFPSRLSVSWSEGRQGPSGSEFEFNRQLVVGYGAWLHPSAFASLEYVRSTGFAPLLGITTASDRNVAQDSVVFGVNLVY